MCYLLWSVNTFCGTQILFVGILGFILTNQVIGKVVLLNILQILITGIFSSSFTFIDTPKTLGRFLISNSKISKAFV